MRDADERHMVQRDYPVSLRMADAVAETAQRRSFALLAAQLGCALAGAALLGVSSSTLVAGSAGGRFRQAAAAALLLSVILLLAARVFRFDTVWWDARAVAESIKSSAWRYMMRATPFAGELSSTQAEGSFVLQVVDARKARPAIAAALERQREEGAGELSQTMRDTRDAPLAARLTFYLERRLEDQERWYSTKAKSHDSAREAYFVATLGLQVFALLTAFLDWRPGNLNLVSLIVALSASLTAWAQAKRYEESAQAYALARQELDVMEGRLRSATDDAALGAAVAETEEAISREHTMWMARRNR